MLFTYKELFLISFSYTKDKMLAEDAVSETFLKLIKKIHTIKNDKNLNGYLRTIVINESLDILRKRKREVFPGAEYFDKCEVGDSQHQQVKLLLEMLDDNQRKVLLLWQYDFTLREISEKTDFTVNQVRLLLKRAKENFAGYYHKFKGL